MKSLHSTKSQVGETDAQCITYHVVKYFEKWCKDIERAVGT